MTGVTGAGDDEPIERFLDQLVTAGRALPARQLRALLAETEAHLRDDADRRSTGGTAPRLAAAAAVAAFGAAEALTHAEQQRVRVPLPVLALRTLSSSVLLAGVGAVAVGLSGVLGLLLLTGWMMARRLRLDSIGLLPATVRDSVAATAFGGAAVYALGRGVDLGVIASGNGSGQWYSAGLVAAVGGAWFCARLVRDLRVSATPEALPAR